jgi:ketosteroid isomerase-like protein
MRRESPDPYVRFMPITERTTTTDDATVDRLSAAFNRCFETFEAGDDTFTDDAFFDLLPPMWRFQLQGPEVFARQLRAIAEGSPSARILRVQPTSTGFVMEHEETQRGEQTFVARRLWLCEVRDGRIAEVVGYCNGGWDETLRARHAAEAPMLRDEEVQR